MDPVQLAGIGLVVLSGVLLFRASSFTIAAGMWGILVWRGSASAVSGPVQVRTVPLIGHRLLVPANQPPVMLAAHQVPTPEGVAVVRGKVSLEVMDPVKAILETRNFRQVAADVVSAIVFSRLSKGKDLASVQRGLKGMSIEFIGVRVVDTSLTLKEGSGEAGVSLKGLARDEVSASISEGFDSTVDLFLVAPLSGGGSG